MSRDEVAAAPPPLPEEDGPVEADRGSSSHAGLGEAEAGLDGSGLSGEPGIRVAELGPVPEAARRTIEMLVWRLEREQGPLSASQAVLRKALAHLETTLEERTRALRRSEARYRALYNHSPNMLLTVDAAGRITDANRTSASGLRQPVSSLIGKELASFFEPGSARYVLEIVERGYLGAVGKTLSLSDGRRVILTAAPVPGYAREAQVVMQDVTGLEVLESELRHAQRWSALGNLAARVAHEINSPLAVLQGRLEMLEEAHLPPSPAVRRHLELIASKGRRIARIVQNLQVLARPLPAARRVVSLDDAVTHAVERAVSGMETVRVVSEVEPSTLTVLADRSQVELVLVNLIIHAAESMRGRGTVRVLARLLGGNVEVRVEDDGPGIPSELLADPFSPFGFSTRAPKSTGLGLAMCWAVVKEHGGALEAFNLPDGGSCFKFTLPAGHGATPPEEIEEADRRRYRPARLLVVSEDPFLFHTVEEMTSPVGHEISLCRSGRDALDEIRNRALDLVITEILLPDVNGLELRALIHLQNPQLARRTIILSSRPHQPEIEVHYLRKPFSQERLLDCIEETLRGDGNEEQGP